MYNINTYLYIKYEWNGNLLNIFDYLNIFKSLIQFDYTLYFSENL